MMVRDCPRIISMESKQQMLRAENKLPDHMVACVGGGSNAIGSFFEYLDEPEVELIGVEAGGRGIVEGQHAARFAGGRLGVLQGCLTHILHNSEGNIEVQLSLYAVFDSPTGGTYHSKLTEIGNIKFL